MDVRFFVLMVGFVLSYFNLIVVCRRVNDNYKILRLGFIVLEDSFSEEFFMKCSSKV